LTLLTRWTVDPHTVLPDGGIGIVHLGLGAFHRAHQAVLTQRAMLAAGGDWSICAVAQRNPAVRDALRDQDCLFTVAERDAAGERLEVVGSIREVLLATQQSDRLTALLAAETTHVVTITVTEAGYGEPLLGQLIRGLRTRRATDAGLTVISCDNLPDNGRRLGRLVAAHAEPALADWIRRRVTFPNSVVDQIVPATTEADVREVSDRLGLLDRGVVVGEPYRQWVIEDRFAGPRPAWERVGVELVADVEPYQRAKLRLLNGTHSALAYLGLLAGFATMDEVAGRPEFAGYVERLVRTETGYDLDPDPAALLARLTNRRITHRLGQIGVDGRLKLPPRLLAPAAELMAAGREPRLICLALAAFQLWEKSSVEDLLPESLRGSRAFAALLAGAVSQLEKHGVVNTLRSSAWS
jgi:fructuronate reductase